MGNIVLTPVKLKFRMQPGVKDSTETNVVLVIIKAA